MRKFTVLSLMVILILALCLTSFIKKQTDDRLRIASEMERSAKTELLDPWYPKSVDKEFGGFLSSFSYDFKPVDQQDKMIVSQSRHIWTNCKASLVSPKYFSL